MLDINPKLGPPLMLIFVVMTNILLVTSLISILSDSFSKVIAKSREEYLFVYSGTPCLILALPLYEILH